jgi:hypothetical protein
MDMPDFVLEPSPKTPAVKFNSSTGVLEMSGRSIIEISNEFYEPIIGWVDDYEKNAPSETVVLARFEYFNTNSSKSILNLFRRLEAMHTRGKSNVKVKWYCEQDDEAMEEAGAEYQMLLSLPFEVVPSDQ